MPPVTSAPSMSYSPAYYHNRTHISAPPVRETGPASSHAHQSSAGQQHQQHHSHSPVAARPASQQSSESGRPSKPVRALEQQQSGVGKSSPQSISLHTFSFSPNAEEGLINHGPNKGAKRYSRRQNTTSGQRSPRPGHMTAAVNTTVYTYPSEGGGIERPVDHAVLVLLWLACLDPFYSLFSALYTIFAVSGLLLLTPFRLCRSSSSVGDLNVRVLAPLFRLHLRLMHAESAYHAHELEFKAGRLIAIQVASPVISAGVAIGEWVAAPFWIFAIIMGNPDGTERRDDGRATVLAIRNWWEHCLLKAATR